MMDDAQLRETVLTAVEEQPELFLMKLRTLFER